MARIYDPRGRAREYSSDLPGLMEDRTSQSGGTPAGSSIAQVFAWIAGIGAALGLTWAGWQYARNSSDAAARDALKAFSTGSAPVTAVDPIALPSTASPFEPPAVVSGPPPPISPAAVAPVDVDSLKTLLEEKSFHSDKHRFYQMRPGGIVRLRSFDPSDTGGIVDTVAIDPDTGQVTVKYTFKGFMETDVLEQIPGTDNLRHIRDGHIFQPFDTTSPPPATGPISPSGPSVMPGYTPSATTTMTSPGPTTTPAGGSGAATTTASGGGGTAAPSTASPIAGSDEDVAAGLKALADTFKGDDDARAAAAKAAAPTVDDDAPKGKARKPASRSAATRADKGADAGGGLGGMLDRIRKSPK